MGDVSSRLPLNNGGRIPHLYGYVNALGKVGANFWAYQSVHILAIISYKEKDTTDIGFQFWKMQTSRRWSPSFLMCSLDLTK